MREALSKSGLTDYSFCAFSQVEKRLLPCVAQKRLPESAKTIICFLFPYKVKNSPPENISRYAAVPDYHSVCGSKLGAACDILKREFPNNKFEHFTDNSPIPEVFAASTAGLGLVGDNGLLITRKYGSFVFLGEIVTDLELPCYSEYMECIHCGECKRVCPVALSKQSCLSLVSQKKGELTEKEARALKDHKIIWGCDICADACPFNKYAQYTYISEFEQGYRDSFSPSESAENRPYAWRGTHPINRNFSLLNF